LQICWLLLYSEVNYLCFLAAQRFCNKNLKGNLSLAVLAPNLGLVFFSTHWWVDQGGSPPEDAARKIVLENAATLERLEKSYEMFK